MRECERETARLSRKVVERGERQRDKEGRERGRGFTGVGVRERHKFLE